MKRRNHRGSAADNPAIRTPQVRALHTGTETRKPTARIERFAMRASRTNSASTERWEQQLEKLETLRCKRDDLTWENDSGPDGKPPSKTKQKQLDALQREIAALEDTTADRQMELEKSSYKVNMQTVIKASAFDRAMKLEAELNKIHGRIIKLLDSIKGYEMESRRLRLEERKYKLAKQKLSGAFDVDPETGEIIDEVDDPCGDPEI